MTRKISNPRLLLVSANSWSTAGQTASALVLAGFQVAVVAPADNPIHLLKKLHARFPYRSRTSPASIKFAITAWSPDILVLTDDVAAGALRSLYFSALRRPYDSDSTKLIELLEYSFGNLQSFAMAQSKSEVLSIASSLGIACPKTVLLSNGYDFAVEDLGLAFPLIVKTDDAWGGLGVRAVNDRPALLGALSELSLPYRLPEKLKRILGRMLRVKLLRSAFERPRKISLQQYVVGRPCTRAAVCWKGRVLAGVTVDVLATLHEFGPSAVVKVKERSNVTDAVEKLVAKLGLSGFLGFDFMVDGEDNTWFLEMNPRATPTCHFSTANDDLPSSFFAQITGTRRNAAGCTVDQAFSLFPYGTRRALQRTPNLPGEKGAPHGEPEFIERCRVQEGSRIRDWIWYSDPRPSPVLRQPSELKQMPHSS